jgi:hypothetical protein
MVKIVPSRTQEDFSNIWLLNMRYATHALEYNKSLLQIANEASLPRPLTANHIGFCDAGLGRDSEHSVDQCIDLPHCNLLVSRFSDAILFISHPPILYCFHQCLLFAFKVARGACEYKIMSTPHGSSSSLLALRY